MTTRKDLLDDLMEAIRDTIDRHTRTCINCRHFALATEVCQVVQQRPPATAIACGCEKWEEK